VAHRYWKAFASLYCAVPETLGSRQAVIEPIATEEERAKLHLFDSLQTDTKRLVLNANYII
jgi:hypothetical protein